MLGQVKPVQAGHAQRKSGNYRYWWYKIGNLDQCESTGNMFVLQPPTTDTPDWRVFIFACRAGGTAGFMWFIFITNFLSESFAKPPYLSFKSNFLPCLCKNIQCSYTYIWMAAHRTQYFEIQINLILFMRPVWKDDFCIDTPQIFLPSFVPGLSLAGR